LCLAEVQLLAGPFLVTKLFQEGLKEIHNIACKEWQQKIIDYANRNPFGDTVELTDKEVIQMYKAATTEQKVVLSKWLKKPIEDKNAFIKRFEVDKLTTLSQELFGDKQAFQIIEGLATKDKYAGRGF